MFLTIAVFILILSVLILVHESGHFIVARNRGVKVEEFGFGFPPRIFSATIGETIYSFNAIPIGGFVKLYGEDGEENLEVKNETRETQRAFFNKKIWERMVIVLAGVTMNVVLAMFLLGIGHWLGLPVVLDDTNRVQAASRTIQIIQVAPNSPAEIAGMKMGDSIKKLNIPEAPLNKFMEVTSVSQVQKFIDRHRGEEIIIGIVRGNNGIELNIVPRLNPPEGEGAIGIAMSEVGFIRYPWYIAIWKGIESTFFAFIMIIMAFAGIIKTAIIGKPIPVDIAGPVGIAVLANQIAQMGVVYILQFAAIISVNLAIINAFPFPALDGGRVLFLLIEKIKGSPINQKIEGTIHRIGFALLIVLMVFITLRDIAKFF